MRLEEEVFVPAHYSQLPNVVFFGSCAGFAAESDAYDRVHSVSEWDLLVVRACEAATFFEKEVKQVMASLQRGKFEGGRRIWGRTSHLLGKIGLFTHWHPRFPLPGLVSPCRTIKMAFPAPRHRRTGSWLSRVLGLPAPVSPPHSDSESHRSTAADVPIVTEIPTYAESSAQTETQPLERFIERVEAARKLIRRTVESVREPPLEKRRKGWKEFESGLVGGGQKAGASTTEKNPQQSQIPNVIMKKEAEIAAIPDFQPPPVPLSPPRVPQAPAPSPQSSSASSPSITFAREKLHIPSVSAAPSVPVSSFFVQQPVSAQDFIEDSGFAAGAEDSSDAEGEEAEPVASPQTNSLFGGNSTSVFAGNSGVSVFGNQMFAGNASISLFGQKNTTSLFAAPANHTGFLANSGSLFTSAAGPLQSSKPLLPAGSGTSLFAPQGADAQVKNSAFQPMKPFQLDTQKKEPGGLVFASPIFTFAQGETRQPEQPKAQDKPQSM